MGVARAAAAFAAVTRQEEVHLTAGLASSRATIRGPYAIFPAGVLE